MTPPYRPGSRTLSRLATIAALCLVACGDDPTNPPVTPGPDAAPSVPETWNRLIDVEWTLAPGEEKYICGTRTMTEDVYVTGYRPLATPAVHHSTLSYDDAQGPDTPTYICSGNGDRFYAFATGANTNALEFPPGVGMHLAKGKQLRLTTHLFNTSDETVTVTAGVEGFVVASSKVQHEAEIYVTGPVDFTDAPATLVSDCELDRDQTLVAILPHMHERGRHFKAELVAASGEVTLLYDEDFDFDSQEAVPLLVPAKKGDKVRTTCTWDTTTGPIRFGSSTNDEMCYSFLTRYPSVGSQDHFCRK